MTRAIATQPPTARRLLALGVLSALALAPRPARAESALEEIEASVPDVPPERYVLQLGWDNHAPSFHGIAQLALHTNVADRDFVGLLQMGLWNASRNFAGTAQLGLQNIAERFIGGAQVGIHNVHRSLFIGALQLGVYNQADRELYTGFQAGVVNEARSFIGGAQVGALNMMRGGRDFLGPSQFGLVNIIESSVYSAVGQIGLVNWVRDKGSERWYRPQLSAPFQIGALNMARRFFGGAQIGGVNICEDTIALLQLALVSWNNGDAAYVQIGIANFARRVTGVQIGLFNLAARLRGIQIGVVNWVQRARWPMIPIVNASL